MSYPKDSSKRKPLAACRVVIGAAIWLDPADSHSLITYGQGVRDILLDFAHKLKNNYNQLAKHCSSENCYKWQTLANSEIDC